MKSYAADAELAELIRAVARSGEPLEIVVGDDRFSVVVAAQANGLKREPLSEADVARSLAGVRRAAGSWRGLIDAEEFKAYIRERRRTSSRPDVEL